MIYRIRLIFHLLRFNHTILYNLFFVYFADHCRVDDCLDFTLSDVARFLYEQFAIIAP